MNNSYVEWRFIEFKEHFYAQNENTQIGLISWYYSSSIWQILSWRMYCRFLTFSFIDNWSLPVWEETIDAFLDKVEEFFESKINKLYSGWERNLQTFIIKNLRKRNIK